LLKGQLNGRLLEVDEELTTPTTAAATSTTTPSGEDGVLVVNETGNIRATFPAAWGDVQTDCIWKYSGEQVGPCLAAATDLDRFQDEWDAGGAMIAASGTLGLSPIAYLDRGPNIMSSDASECSIYDGRTDYDDGVYVGSYDLWSGCGDTGATAVIIAAEPEDQAFLVVVILKMVTDADTDALGEIIRTYMVDNTDF